MVYNGIFTETIGLQHFLTSQQLSTRMDVMPSGQFGIQGELLFMGLVSLEMLVAYCRLWRGSAKESPCSLLCGYPFESSLFNDQLPSPDTFALIGITAMKQVTTADNKIVIFVVL